MQAIGGAQQEILVQDYSFFTSTPIAKALLGAYKPGVNRLLIEGLPLKVVQ